MTRIFSIKLSKSLYPNDWVRYEVVAPTAVRAIDKATARAKKETRWYGGWVVEELIHRGPAT